MEIYITSIILFSFTFLTYLYCLFKDKKGTKKASMIGIKVLTKNSIRLFSIFIIIGILQNFISKENMSSFLIKFSGLKGILVGFLTGSIMMGPVASGYPIAEYVKNNGGSIGLITAFLTSWVLLGIISISMEFKNLGTKFTILRNICSFIIIILISIIMEIIL